MSSNEHDRVLEALNVLSFQKLQALAGYSSVETQGLSTAASDFRHSSSAVSKITDKSCAPLNTQASASSIHQSSSPPSADAHGLSPPESIVKLIEAVNNGEEKIKDFLSGSEFKATRDELQRIIEDPRIVDLQLDRTHVSYEARFRKCLSQRSLAIEYEQWLKGSDKLSRVDELVEDISISQERGTGHIEEYLNLNLHRFINQRATRTGIEHGIKILVFEKLLGDKAISATLSFKYSRFRAVRYKDLESLVTNIKQIKWIMELVPKKAVWLDSCQNQYDAWCSEISRGKGPREPSPEPSRKRRRLDQAVTHHPLGSPSDNHLSQRSTSQFGNQISATAWERGNSGGDAEQSQAETHEGPRSGVTQWEREATENNENTMHIRSAPTQVQSNIQNNLMHSDVCGNDNTNPTQWIAECEPRISSTPCFNLAALAKANPPPPLSEHSAYPYYPEIPAQGNAPPQETSGYNLAVLAKENLSLPHENSAYDPAVSAQANSTPLLQENTGYSYNLAVLAKENLSLPYKDLVYPDDSFTVSPQPPSLNV